MWHFHLSLFLFEVIVTCCEIFYIERNAFPHRRLNLRQPTDILFPSFIDCLLLLPRTMNILSEELSGGERKNGKLLLWMIYKLLNCRLEILVSQCIVFAGKFRPFSPIIHNTAQQDVSLHHNFLFPLGFLFDFTIDRQVSFGNMVACDSPECSYEWFHFQCVGLTEEVSNQSEGLMIIYFLKPAGHPAFLPYPGVCFTYGVCSFYRYLVSFNSNSQKIRGFAHNAKRTDTTSKSTPWRMYCVFETKVTLPISRLLGACIAMGVWNYSTTTNK